MMKIISQIVFAIFPQHFKTKTSNCILKMLLKDGNGIVNEFLTNQWHICIILAY